tara:strand:- start:128 stop:409 length:282 start_codon:yes stop_codon:yes gene_type:complete
MADFKFEIEDDIPVPPDFHTGLRKYPFAEMKVGQSIFLAPEYEDESVKRLGNRVAQARQSYQKKMAKLKTPVQFTQRIDTKDETLGYRVWRVS